MVVEITIHKMVYLFVMFSLILNLWGCSGDDYDGSKISVEDSVSDKQMQPTLSEDEKPEEDLQIAINTPDLDIYESLSTALDMLVVYGVNYDESMHNPDEDFWNGFVSALICNSWFGPFSDENHTDQIWDNEKIAEAGSLITGRELTCNCFSDGIDAAKNAYSPYLAWASKVNVHTEPLAENKFEISYDMMWAPVSMTSIDGMIRVSAIVEVNQSSPLDGYSILSLNQEEVFCCVYMVFGEFDYNVSEDNGVIVNSLYQLIDGSHTAINNENLRELLDNADDKEYVFADINGDSNDDMIIRTNECDPDFFFYTDEGILWITSPISSGYEIWFTEDYLVVGKDSQSTEETYVVYQVGSDGKFKQVMMLRTGHEEGRKRFIYATEQGVEKDITEEEYAYLTAYLESKEKSLEWVKIP